MNANTEQQDPLAMALTEHGLVVTDLVWAMEWLNSFIDDLNTLHEQEYHPRAIEFLDELAERRKVKITLNSVAREVGL